MAMGLPNSRQGSQKAMLLAGFLLGCLLQLAPAQPRLSLTPEPSDPVVGKDIRLSLRGAPRQFVQCLWFRHSHSGRLENIFKHFAQRQPEKGRGHRGRETLQDGCSLHIAKLVQSDTGNYTVVIEVGPEQQQTGQQFVGRNYSVSYYLQVSSFIPIVFNPPRPVPGQQLTLVPQSVPRQFSICTWVMLTRSSGWSENILEYIPGDRDQQSSSQGRAEVRSDCSLHIRQLDVSDTGNYTVEIEAPLKQQPGQGTFPQQPEAQDSQVYKGRVYLDVIQQSGQGPAKSHAPASLSYSAAVVAGALVGSLAWADTLIPAFSGLFCSLTSLRHKVLP